VRLDRAWDPDSGAPQWLVYDAHATKGAAAERFTGTVFDGRYVYFVPNQHTLLLRYDAMGAGFQDDTAWSTFDTKKVNAAGASQFCGGAFDGRYVYFVPWQDGVVLRFDARYPAEMPATYKTAGSFL
jgi:hypothetical protein